MKPSEQDLWEEERNRVIGLGERSFRKSYYPELRQNLSRLERFQALLDFLGEMVLLVELPDGIVVDANSAAGVLLGIDSARLPGTALSALGFAEILPALRASACDQNAPQFHAELLLQRDDRTTPLDLSYRAVNLDGRSCCVIVGHDATARHAAEAQLRLSARVFEASGEGIIITDAQANIVEVNHRFEDITGYRREEVLGRNPRILASGRHDAAFFHAMWQTLGSRGFWQGEIWDRRKDGEIYPEWLTISAIRDEQGNICNYVAMFSDVTERKSAEAHIKHMAQHDYLTGLPNRFLLHDRFQQLAAAARREGKSFALFFIDLDRFKNINDSLGHSVGDHLLCQVAERLTLASRASDTVSRLGGDEFIVLLPDMHTPEDAARIACKLLRELALPCRLGAHEFSITPSIGIATYPDDGEDLDSLLKHADIAMYKAKQQGRNNFQFYRHEMNERTLELLLMEAQLRKALQRGEFELFYQPQVEISTQRVVAVEALIRWHHPELGLVSPDRFIPIAEEIGLIQAIGDWVLKEACRQLAKWRRGGWPTLRVAVNLSAIQFRQPDLVEHVATALHVTGVEPEALELEVTESVVMENAETAIAAMCLLRDMGVSLAIDDFGTGYSSLAYLKRFPVANLKIDRSFVRDIAHDEDGATICAAIISLAQALRMGVVAEGVETMAQLAWLQAAACPVVQGFLLARPQAVEACTQTMMRLKNGNSHEANIAEQACMT